MGNDRWSRTARMFVEKHLGCDDIHDVERPLAAMLRARDEQWRDALFPGNEQTALGEMCLDPNMAAGVTREGEKLAIEERDVEWANAVEAAWHAEDGLSGSHPERRVGRRMMRDEIRRAMGISDA